MAVLEFLSDYSVLYFLGDFTDFRKSFAIVFTSRVDFTFRTLHVIQPHSKSFGTLSLKRGCTQLFKKIYFTLVGSSCRFSILSSFDLSSGQCAKS